MWKNHSELPTRMQIYLQTFGCISCYRKLTNGVPVQLPQVIMIMQQGTLLLVKTSRVHILSTSVHGKGWIQCFAGTAGACIADCEMGGVIVLPVSLIFVICGYNVPSQTMLMTQWNCASPFCNDIKAPQQYTCITYVEYILQCSTKCTVKLTANACNTQQAVSYSPGLWSVNCCTLSSRSANIILTI